MLNKNCPCLDQSSKFDNQNKQNNGSQAIHCNEVFHYIEQKFFEELFCNTVNKLNLKKAGRGGSVCKTHRSGPVTPDSTLAWRNTANGTGA